MTETGIIMSGEDPRLIIDLTKTMTRRTYGLEEINKDPDNWHLAACFQDGIARFFCDIGDELTLNCPYGGYGDRLWVRETFYESEYFLSEDDLSKPKIYYKADGEQEFPHDKHWKPSIHMPRWASRITLEITDIRVERVQEITEEDATAEGIELLKPSMCCYTNRYCFQVLWDSLNAKRGYGLEVNPFVWVISFKVVS